MGARTKLNVAFVNGVLAVAVLAGVSTGSGIVFGIVAAIGIGLAVYEGNIRPPRR